VPHSAPFGSWSSPITAAALVSGAAAPGEIRADGDDVWWSESRPSEAGRVQLVRRSSDGTGTDVLPDGYSTRTRAHEYGGGSWCVAGGRVVFANADDQRLYRLDPDAEPVAITPEPTDRHGLRYADLATTPDGRWVMAVRESHGADRPDAADRSGDEAVNEIVAVPLEGDADPVVLVSGPDFVASPTVAPGGDRLVWVQWEHPDMPWDATELMVAPLCLDEPATGAGTASAKASRIAGGPGESVVDPQWAPDGSLTFLSDRTGWWNPYRWNPGDGAVTALAPVEAEIGGALWVFGLRYLAWLGDGRFVCSLTAEGLDRLALAAADGTAPTTLDVPFTHISQVVAGRGGSVLVVAGTATDESAPYRVIVPAGSGGTLTVERLRPVRDLGLGADPAAWFSVPEAIEVPTTDDAVTHALLYRPRNPDFDGPPGEAPPLLVLGHGGPTSAARAQLNLSIQFWTSRGFCVADVNYRGSTGYGRAYRDELRGRWGIADVDDCVAVARFLAERGDVDPRRLAIRGGSAGGFTTLAALTFHDTFTAGASHYGIADLEVLARDTHKFEARYLDGLVGPWPSCAATYQERSPIHHTDGLSCPVAIFQGLEDAVVPPEQAELMVAALRRKGVPYAYLAFEGEQHGFRQAPNIIRALEGELWFYGRVFGFEPADPIEPVPGAGF
jgi:dipeptidyl aminopeptidase/acylaminoacyl peptidase